MKRRSLCIAALPAWAPWRAVRGQARQRIGFLNISAPSPDHPLVRAQVDALRELGFVDGRNVAFDYRWAGGVLAALPALAGELAALPVDVIVAGNNNAIAAARQASSTIPIVMVLGVDPVRNGYIQSFARPGGQITGLTNEAGQTVHGKMLGMLKELVPRASLIGVLVQRGLGYDRAVIEAAARLLQVQLHFAPEVHQTADIEPSFLAIQRAGAQAMHVIGGSVIYAARQQLVELELHHRMAAMHFSADYVRAGGLISYGTDLLAQYRRSAHFIARILQGARPADLPVELPVRFELALNLPTARVLGLNVPRALLLRADEVIA